MLGYSRLVLNSLAFFFSMVSLQDGNRVYRGKEPQISRESSGSFFFFFSPVEWLSGLASGWDTWSRTQIWAWSWRKAKILTVMYIPCKICASLHLCPYLLIVPFTLLIPVTLASQCGSNVLSLIHFRASPYALFSTWTVLFHILMFLVIYFKISF